MEILILAKMKMTILRGCGIQGVPFNFSPMQHLFLFVRDLFKNAITPLAPFSFSLASTLKETSKPIRKKGNSQVASLFAT